MKAYVDTLNTVMIANVQAANTAIVTANTGAVSYVNTLNSAMVANVQAANAAIVTANTGAVSYVNTLNSAMVANVQAANTAIITANTDMKAYVDTQVAAGGGGGGGGGYGNTQVAAYLQIYSGSLGGTLSTASQTNITTVGTLTGLTVSGEANITNTTLSTSTSTGALIVAGGVGVAGNLYVGGVMIGSTVMNVRNISVNTFINSVNGIIFASDTITLTLPLASINTGNSMQIKNIGTGTVTVNCSGSDTIDNSATAVMSYFGTAIGVVSNGLNWYII
jgi:hypothetical protein